MLEPHLLFPGCFYEGHRLFLVEEFGLGLHLLQSQAALPDILQFAMHFELNEGPDLAALDLCL